MLGSVARKYAHKIPFILKLNHNEFISYPNAYDQIRFASVKQAFDMGAVGRRRDDLLRVGGIEAADRRKCRRCSSRRTSWGMFTVLWCYLRNPAFKTKEVDYHLAADLTGQANHLGVTIEADIIKQKLPENNGGYNALNFGKTHKAVYSQLTSDNPIDLTRYQLANCYMGRAAADQLGRRVGGRERPEGSGEDRRHQQARRRHGPDLGPQGVPAADEGRRRRCSTRSRTSTWRRTSRSPRRLASRDADLVTRPRLARNSRSASCVLRNASSSHGISSASKNLRFEPSSSQHSSPPTIVAA